MKYFILNFLVVFSSISFGQITIPKFNKDSLGYYNLGVEAYNKNDIIKADSFFAKSLSCVVSRDALFNHAVTRLILKDTCVACKNFKIVGEYYNDIEAFKIYIEICLQHIDTIYYNKKYEKIENASGYKYYEELRTPKCDSITEVFIHKKNHSLTKKTTLGDCKTESVDIYAAYLLIDSSKNYYFIYSSSFQKDNKVLVETFKNNLKKYLNVKYNFDEIPITPRNFSVKILVNKEGEIVKSIIQSRQFEYLDKSKRNNIELDIYNSIEKMPQLKPGKYFGKPINMWYEFLVEL
ncbi:MAG: hypothetical protein WC868_02665 [Bacteroidales bacterium]